MGVITLTSDWGTADYYIGAVKGMIYKHFPEAQIVDISHEINKFDSGEAAFMLRHAYPSFPDGTIHIIGINTEETIEEPHTIAFYMRQYFIGTDNGVFSMIFDGLPEWMIELDIPQESTGFTFSSRDRFAIAAARIARGDDPQKMGDIKPNLVKKMLFNPVIDQGAIKAMVIHIDGYQNLITNIDRKTFMAFVKNSAFVISFRSQKYKVSEVKDAYTDARPGEIVAVFASNGLLEIAINQGKAASLLGIRKNDPVIVSLVTNNDSHNRLF
ncbi:MAG: SAM-dependent chlorinase/fluorinase [Bacteroidales bacterium]|jgi:hypothetical protein